MYAHCTVRSAQPGLLNRCVRRHKVAIVVASVASVCLVNSAHLYWPLHFCVCLYISVCLLSCELYIHRCVRRDKVAIVVGSVTSVSGSITASPRLALIMPIYSPGPAQWEHCIACNTMLSALSSFHFGVESVVVYCASILLTLMCCTAINTLCTFLEPLSSLYYIDTYICLSVSTIAP